MPTLYVAITNHGFGHATRTAAVIAEVQRQCADIEIIVATTAPQWLLESYIPSQFHYHSQAFDVGVIQADSLQIDREATFNKLLQLEQQAPSLIEAEVEFLKSHQVDLLFGDIPPLVTKIAKAAGIPCWMSGNFGWDFIYRDWGGEFVEVADRIADTYGECDRLFRLPFHEPMPAFSTAEVIDTGLTGGCPKLTELEIREKFQLSDKRPTALLTFGGLSLSQIPYENLSKFPDWQFITFDRNAPDLPNLTQVTDHHLRPVDFMVVCDRIISKPGYSTISEACRLGKPIVCLTRDGFIEAENLLAGVKAYASHLIISPDEFYRGNWDFLTASLEPPQSDTSLDTHGEITIAQAIVEYLS